MAPPLSAAMMGPAAMNGPKPGMANAPIPANNPIVPPRAQTPPVLAIRSTFGHLCFFLVSEITGASLIGEQHGNIIIREAGASKLSDDGVGLSFCINET